MDCDLLDDSRRVRKKEEEHQRPCLAIPYMTGRRGDVNVRPTHPTIADTTHVLVPRGLTHVSEGRAERFVSDTGAILGARLHLSRYGQKQLKPETMLGDAREATSS